MDVSRETSFGILYSDLENGFISEYNRLELDNAYVIFKDIIKRDLEGSVVPIDILKLARDPITALQNIIEKTVAFDINQMKGKD